MESKIGYKQLPEITDPDYILEIPPEGTDLSQWKPEWNKGDDFEEFLEEQEKETRQKKEDQEEARRRARAFYQKTILLVYKPEFEDEAEYFLGILNENRNKLDSSLPPPRSCIRTQKTGDGITIIWACILSRLEIKRCCWRAA